MRSGEADVWVWDVQVYRAVHVGGDRHRYERGIQKQVGVLGVYIGVRETCCTQVPKRALCRSKRDLDTP